MSLTPRPRCQVSGSMRASAARRGAFTLIGLVVALISDLLYTWIDPRIDFEAREL